MGKLYGSQLTCSWRLQFWYTEDTASTVAREAVEAAGPSGRIACIACPSLFRQLRAKYPDANAHLFEVDLRFEVRPCILQDHCLASCSCHSSDLHGVLGAYL